MTKAFTRPVFYRWLIPVLLEWAAIIGLFAIGFAMHHWLVWVFVVILLGSRQQALGLLGHDGSHYTASRNIRLNDFTSALFCFWPALTSLGDYRRLHLNHHRYLNTERDPELIFKTKVCPRQWHARASRGRIAAFFLSDLFGFGLIEVMQARNLLRMRGPYFAYIPENSRPAEWKSWVGPIVWLFCITTLLYLTGYLFALLIWFAALGTSFWAFLRLRSWTEHPLPTTAGSAEIKAFPPESATHFVRLNWWQRLFIAPHNSWAHYEHHKHPGVPFWRLKEIGRDDTGRSSDPQRTQRLGELFASFERS